MKTKSHQNFAIRRKINVTRQAFIRNAGRLVINAIQNLNVKTRKRETFARKTKRNVTRSILRKNARRPAEPVKCYVYIYVHY